MRRTKTGEAGKSKQITLVLPQQLIEEARELASRTGVTRNRIVTQALDRYLTLHSDEGEQDADKKQ
jgi:metal-responsive CopG/Arc/MetJ family transcriptional regulator